MVEGGAVKTMGSTLNPSPCVEGKDDGRFLPFFMNLPPFDALKAGKFLKVPLLTGVTKEETSTAVQGCIYKIYFFNPRFSSIYTKKVEENIKQNVTHSVTNKTTYIT